MIEKICEEIARRDSTDGTVKVFSGKEVIEIVQEVAMEYGNGWIPCSERLPSKEECGKYGRKEFQVTIPQHDGNATVAMDYEYTTVRGKEVARWLWAGRISPWEVLAWKTLDAPYQKGE